MEIWAVSNLKKPSNENLPDSTPEKTFHSVQQKRTGLSGAPEPVAVKEEPAEDMGRQARGHQVLFFDMSYNFSMFQKRGLGQALEARRLEGFFTKVISIHPLAGVLEAGNRQFGSPEVHRVSPDHVFVEGRIGLLPLPCWLAPINLLLAQWQLVRKVIRLLDPALPTIIRAGDPYYLGLLGLCMARWLRAPLVLRIPFRYDEITRTTGRAVNPRLFKWRKLEKIIERFVLRRADLVAGANQDNLDYALENGARPERGTVFRYGNLLHPAHWEDPRSRALPSRASLPCELRTRGYLVVVSRLEAEKKVADVLHATKRLREHNVSLPVVIIGDGSGREELRRMAQDLGLEKTVHFVGIRDQEWIAGVLAHAAGAMSPHMGRALTEAALAGIPVVAYDYDWQRELIEDGVTGILVPNGNWEQLANSVLKMLQNPELASHFGKNLRAKAANLMDPKRLTQHEIQKIKEVLSRIQSGGRDY